MTRNKLSGIGSWSDAINRSRLSLLIHGASPGRTARLQAAIFTSLSVPETRQIGREKDQK